ncbi:MAG: sigma-70 family RNA polymerase sigma factor [Planctomycetota bacterium]
MSADEPPSGLPDAAATSPATEWIAAAGRGDERALDVVFTVLRRRLLRIVALRTGRHAGDRDADLEDVVQEALLHALRELHADRFATSGELLRWITTVAMNDVRDRARGRRIRPDGKGLPDAWASILGDDGRPTPLDRVYENELEEATDRALAALDDEDRELLLMRNYEGLSAREMAALLGLRSEEAVRARVHRARRRLQEALEPFLRE